MTTSVSSTARGGDRPARISWPITIGLFGVSTVLGSRRYRAAAERQFGVDG